ncbi:alpha/beta fold hydrolase [Sporosarcina limicola]|uniref:Pimeloyl-ACP methyl ester carboxylesterase n=1 Tax=Sporosarcina limicola TaxID=34101 RepID=A0A927RCB4_9BACL|nr:alpha/beta hydrolase [Sporosarcina limicola]MBE1554190.1 pimeloyl-ACP methyl ester carboxylesterase [Sporosarcina limicola]
MTFHYEEYGNKEGPLVVFIHGGGVSGWMWDKQVEHFSNYYCLVPTLQGHGCRSEETSFSIKKNAPEIIDLIEQKRNGREVNVVGFSIGAQITVEMLSLAPDLIHSAVINSALVTPLKMMKSLVAPSIKLTFPLIKNKSFSKIQAKQLYMDGEYFERYYRDSLKMKPEIVIEMLKENMSYILPDRFSTSTARILVTVGERERGIMKKSAAMMAHGNANCESLIVQKVGHGFSVAQPELFNQVVEAWMQEKSILV